MAAALERVIAPPWGPDDEAYREHLARYDFALPLVKDLQVLDVACGSGFGSALLAKKASRAVGVDKSPEAVSFAREHYQLSNLDFQIADAATLPFEDKSFDVIVSFETIEHLLDQEKFLQEAKRVLKDNGMLIISTPDREILPKFFVNPEEYQNPFHVKELSRGEFEDLLRGYFPKIDFYGQGLYHDKASPGARRLLSFMKNWFGPYIPGALKKKIKSGLLGAGDTNQIARLEANQRAKYLIAVCQA